MVMEKLILKNLFEWLPAKKLPHVNLFFYKLSGIDDIEYLYVRRLPSESFMLIGTKLKIYIYIKLSIRGRIIQSTLVKNGSLPVPKCVLVLMNLFLQNFVETILAYKVCLLMTWDVNLGCY